MLSNLLQGTQFESGRVGYLNPGSLAPRSLYSTITLNYLYFIHGHLAFVLTSLLQSVISSMIHFPLLYSVTLGMLFNRSVLQFRHL